MVEFKTAAYNPMDRAYHERVEMDAVTPTANIEEPILPIARLGVTVPEHGRTQNILQNVQSAIRGGTGSLQIVFETPVESAIGGRPKAYGKEVRQAIRELALANEVAITGMEMPTSMTNLSGWDERRGVVDETKRQRDLDEVKEMVRFAAEVGQGGGVDIVSWEFERPLHRAKWLDDESNKAFAQQIKEEKRVEQIRFVDERSGAITAVPIRENIMMFIDKNNFKDDQLENPEPWGYDDFQNWVQWKTKTKGQDIHGQEFNNQLVLNEIKEYFFRNQMNIAEAERGHYKERLQRTQSELQRPNLDKASKEFLKQQESAAQSGIRAQSRTIREFQERIEHWKDFDQFVLDKSEASYAEAGVEAMQMQDDKTKSNAPLKQDLFVGPELGWPQFFGSHPREFKEVIMGARKQMVHMLTNPAEAERLGLEEPMKRGAAETEAEKHIKGTFDTSHMGMWLQNFRPELPWHKRIKEFEKWYGDQVDWLAKENRQHNLLGSIQAVDSAGAAHGHLPPGQGILPVKKAIETLTNKGGFRGYVLSEGHEEEKFGQGRIMLKNWQEFNAPFATGYQQQMPAQRAQRWGEVQHSYFGRTYSPSFMFGSYAPSNEFKLWSEIPLE